MGFISEHVDINIQQKDDAIHVPHLEVHIEHRNRRFGTRALERVIELANEHNKSTVTARISRTEPFESFDNDPTVRLLRSLGFTVEDEHREVYGELALDTTQP